MGKEIQDEEEEELGIEEKPKRKKMRLEAYTSMTKKGEQMKHRALKFDGEVRVGDIVKISVSGIDVRLNQSLFS